MRTLFVSIFLCAALVSSAFAQEKPYVVFANPGNEGDVFFQPVTNFMRAAAQDLGFDLEVYYTQRAHSHILYDEVVMDILSKPHLPDYIVGMNPRGAGEFLLKQAEANGIKVVFFNQGFLGEEAERIGGPGDTYANWLFQLLPDDTNSGEILAEALAQAARKKGLVNDQGKVDMVALNGHKHSAASILRQAGLKKAVSEDQSIKLHQIINANWKRDKAKKLTRGLLKRYPDTVAIWAASDLMAEGALDAVHYTTLNPGSNILLGGIDWTKRGIGLVEKGELAVTVGGHFMEGGWALVMLYDLINGVDVPKSSTSHFSVITADNVGEYRTLFDDGDWSKVDFRQFSKHLHPEIKEYDFSLDAVLRQFR